MFSHGRSTPELHRVQSAPSNEGGVEQSTSIPTFRSPIRGNKQSTSKPTIRRPKTLPSGYAAHDDLESRLEASSLKYCPENAPKWSRSPGSQTSSEARSGPASAPDFAAAPARRQRCFAPVRTPSTRPPALVEVRSPVRTSHNSTRADSTRASGRDHKPTTPRSGPPTLVELWEAAGSRKLALRKAEKTRSLPLLSGGVVTA